MKISKQPFKWMPSALVKNNKIRMAKKGMTMLNTTPFPIVIAGEHCRIWSLGTTGCVSFDNSGKGYWGKLDEQNLLPPVDPLVIPFGERLNPFG